MTAMQAAKRPPPKIVMPIEKNASNGLDPDSP